MLPGNNCQGGERKKKKLLNHKFFPTTSSVVPADNVVDATDIEEEVQLCCSFNG
jgi:hypothetical protein